MGGIHVIELAANDFADTTKVDGGSVFVEGFDFFSEEDIGSGNANGFTTEIADHADEVGIDFVGKDASDDIDGFVAGVTKAVDEFCFDAGLFHRRGNGFSATVNDNGIDTRDF